MDAVMIVLRMIHILSGVFWVGVSLFNVIFLQPTMQATGPDGQKVMQHLTTRTAFTMTVYTAATLNLLSGLIMYWILFKFRLSALSSGYGLTLAIGGLAGLIAWVVALFVIRRIVGQMQEIGRAIQAQGGPPTPEQAAVMQAASARMVKMGQYGLILMAIAVLAMASAQYIRF